MTNVNLDGFSETYVRNIYGSPDPYPLVNISKSSRLFTFPRYAELGDSFTERNSITSSAGVYTSDLGITNMMQVFLGYRLNFIYNDGVSGSGAIAPGVGLPYINRIAAALATNPEILCIRASVNDIPTSASVEELIAAYARLFQIANDTGVLVLTNTIGPGTQANMANDNYRTKWLKFNDWIANKAPRLFDLLCLAQHYQYANPDVLTGECETPGTDLHPTCGAVKRIAYQSALQLDRILTKQSLFDAWAAKNSAGQFSRDSNPTNIGTAGILGTGVTGSVATDWRVTTRDAGGVGTAVAAKVRRYDGPGYWQQVAWTSSAANEQLRYQYVNSAIPPDSDLAIGDEVSWFCEYEIDSATADASVMTAMSYLSFGATSARGQTTTNSGTFGGVAPHRGWVMTPKYAIPVGTVALSPYALMISKAAETFTVRLGRHGFINWTKDTFVQ